MMPAHHLWPLLSPTSVAVVGASSLAGSLGRIVYENILAGGFAGRLHAINPNQDKVLGNVALSSLAEMGDSVDMAVICAPPPAVPRIIADAAGRVRGAVIVSAAPELHPAEYRAWQRQVLQCGRTAGVRILGHAAFGVIRSAIKLNASLSTVNALPGRLALISQSGSVASALLDFAQTARVGFSSVVSPGAGGDVEIGELLEFCLSDPETDGILLYVEHVKDARAFLSALRAAARTKPVIVLRAGRFAERRPGRWPSPDQVFDAALKRAGTVRVETYTELFAAARLLARGQLPHGSRLAIVTNGRGPGLMAADAASDRNVTLATQDAHTSRVLRGLLPAHGATGNPLDIGRDATPERFAAAIRALAGDAGTDALLALHVATEEAPPTDTARAVADAAAGSGKLVLAAWLGAVDRPEARAALEVGGVSDFFTPENAVQALASLARYRQNQAWLLEVPPPQDQPHAPDLAAAERIRATMRAKGLSTLDDEAARTLLAAFGLSCGSRQEAVAVADVDDVIAASRRLRYPVAIDCVRGGATIATRDDLRDRAMLLRAFAELTGRSNQDAEAAASFVVRKQRAGGTSSSLRIRVFRDPVFGPIIVCGSKSQPNPDDALMLPPLSRRLAADFARAACGALATEEHAALSEALLSVSAMACALPWLDVLELDPIRIESRRGAVVDHAQVTIDYRRGAASDDYAHMAIHPYPAELETTLELRDGTTLRVRPIRPEDATLEVEFHAGLSDETRYLRFMQHLKGLSPQLLARFTQVDYDRELALVALEGPPSAERIVAVARYVGNWDGESAEFAIVAADAWQGRGLGHALMKMLIACARKRGFARLVGSVLAVNKGMLDLMRRLGFGIRMDPADRETMLVSLELASVRAAHGRTRPASRPDRQRH